MELAPDDAVVLAVPPLIARTLVPDLPTPDEFRAIVNAHFACPPPDDFPPMIGVINGTVEWIFAFPGRLSVTISGADRLMAQPREELAETIWRDVAAVAGIARKLPPWQIVRERRATFAATPAQDGQAPGHRDRLGQSVAGRRLDRDRPARHDRRRDPIGQQRGRILEPTERTRHEGSMNDAALSQSPPRPSTVTSSALETRIRAATDALLERQQADGHWVFELEADATIPAEYVLLRHYLGEPVGRGARAQDRRLSAPHPAAPHGGWPLFHDGAFDMSASVKAYFALKMIGDDPTPPHMRRAREAILRARRRRQGSNVFTRTLLALYGVMPWRAVPVMPVEIMLLPRWFPFHLSKISYWARTVIVPLLVLQRAQAAGAKNPKGVGIDELFREAAEAHRPARRRHRTRNGRGSCSSAASTSCCAPPSRCFRKRLRKRAIDARRRLRHRAAERRGRARRDLSGDGQHRDDVRRCSAIRRIIPTAPVARKSLDKLLVIKDDEAYCQPCVSPVWDTALACHALLEVGGDAASAAGEARARLARSRCRCST